jgi:hypothetical protein
MHVNAVQNQLKSPKHGKSIGHLGFNDSIVFWTCGVLVCLSQVSQVDEEELNGEVWKPFEAWWVVAHRCIE